jgi:MYXO-CTERM domain-containing protein
MNAKAFALAGTAGSFVVAGAATAAFTGLKIETYVGSDWVDNGYDTTALVTYRLYADFDGGDEDGVLSIFGVTGAPMDVVSPDGVFSNSPVGLDALTAPQDLRFLGIFENQWDTYVTINLDTATGDATGTSPGFATETNSLASDWSTQNAAWFVTPDDAQSQAVDNRVLLAQFTHAAGAGPSGGPSGTVNVLLLDGTELQGVAFGGATPAPGALALLGLAGLAGTRRRRK